MVTVKEILSIPALRPLEIIAGEEGLNKRVSYVTVMEVPDIVRWLKGNDFLISSFYAVKDSLDAQIELIDSLADNRCSCLAIKTGQYLKELDQSIIDRANTRGLVLVQIPNEVSYIEIIFNAMNFIFDNRDIDYMIEKFFKDIIFNNVENQEMVFERGNLLGFNVRNSSSLVISLDFFKDLPDKKNLLRKVAKAVAKESDSFLRFTYNPVVTVGDKTSILFFSSEETGIRSNIPLIIELLNKYISENEDEDIHIGIGTIGAGLEGLKDSYFKSMEALKVGSLINRDKRIYHYDDMIIYISLEKYLRRNGSEVFQTMSNQLGQDLLQTLEAFYESNMDISLTADKLFVHRNTIRYRLNKIKEITGNDIAVSEDNFKLYMFLIYSKMIKDSRLD